MKSQIDDMYMIAAKKLNEGYYFINLRKKKDRFSNLYQLISSKFKDEENFYRTLVIKVPKNDSMHFNTTKKIPFSYSEDKKSMIRAKSDYKTPVVKDEYSYFEKNNTITSSKSHLKSRFNSHCPKHVKDCLIKRLANYESNKHKKEIKKEIKKENTQYYPTVQVFIRHHMKNKHKPINEKIKQFEKILPPIKNVNL